MPGVLIIKLGALGDLLMLAPVMRRIVEHHGDEPVHLLTADEHLGFFSRWPGLNVTAYPRRGAGATLRTLAWIRRTGFRRIYDLQSNDRSSMLCALSGAGERVGNHPRFPYTHHPATRWHGTGHICERWREVLASAGLETQALHPWLPITDAERSAAVDWLRVNDLAGKKFAILHAGASPGHPEKRWPHFRALADQLAEAGHAIVWSGGAADRELNRELSLQGGVDATGAFTLTGLAAVGAHAGFAVTNDSAPMHALACAGIPVFGLFGPTDWRRNHALGQAENVIAIPAGAPLADLSVALVLERLRAAGAVG